MSNKSLHMIPKYTGSASRIVGKPTSSHTMRLLSKIFLPSRGPMGSKLKAAK